MVFSHFLDIATHVGQITHRSPSTGIDPQMFSCQKPAGLLTEVDSAQPKKATSAPGPAALAAPAAAHSESAAAAAECAAPAKPVEARLRRCGEDSGGKDREFCRVCRGGLWGWQIGGDWRCKCWAPSFHHDFILSWCLSQSLGFGYWSCGEGGSQLGLDIWVCALIRRPSTLNQWVLEWFLVYLPSSRRSLGGLPI